MTLGWNATTINGQNVIKTNLTNLGIAIYQDNTRLNNGAVLNFTYKGTMPSLYAIPVKPIGSVLTDGGNFSGILTMLVDYR